MRPKADLGFAAILLLKFSGALAAQNLTFNVTTYPVNNTSTNVGTNTIAVADFNRDGALDVVVSNSTQAFASSSSANYTFWLGQLTSGKPNGQLQATGTALPFFFSGSEIGQNAD